MRANFVGGESFSDCRICIDYGGTFVSPFYGMLFGYFYRWAPNRVLRREVNFIAADKYSSVAVIRKEETELRRERWEKMFPNQFRVRNWSKPVSLLNIICWIFPRYESPLTRFRTWIYHFHHVNIHIEHDSFGAEHCHMTVALRRYTGVWVVLIYKILSLFAISHFKLM